MSIEDVRNTWQLSRAALSDEKSCTARPLLNIYFVFAEIETKLHKAFCVVDAEYRILTSTAT